MHEQQCQPTRGSCTTLCQYRAVLSHLSVTFFFCVEKYAVPGVLRGPCLTGVTGSLSSRSAEEVEKSNVDFCRWLSVGVRQREGGT